MSIAGNKNLFTTTLLIKLNDIEALAEVNLTKSELEALISHDALVDFEAGEHFVLDDVTPATDKAFSSSHIQTELDNLTASLGGRILEPVQDTTALKAIDTTNAGDFPDKTLILAEDDGLYSLNRNSSATEDLPRIVEPTVGVGRWLKLSVSLGDHNNTTNIQGGSVGQHHHYNGTRKHDNVLRQTEQTDNKNHTHAVYIGGATAY